MMSPSCPAHSSFTSSEYPSLPTWQLDARGEWYPAFSDPVPISVPHMTIRQTSRPQSSSLNMALSETLIRPSSPMMRRPHTVTTSSGIPATAPGYSRIQQTCNIVSNNLVIFKQSGQPGVPLDSVQSRNRNLEHCDVSIPWSDSVALLHICWQGYKSGRYCLAVKGTRRHFTYQDLAKSISEHIVTYMQANNINLSLNQLSLVALGLGECGDDWVAVVDRLLC